MNFEKEIEVRWSDVDQNMHVRHSAYYDYGSHTRMAYLISVGYDSKRLAKEGFGPILFHEECTFLKEIKADEKIRINLKVGEFTPDYARGVLHHELFNSKDEKCAHVSVKIAWMDLRERKLRTPPEALQKAFSELDTGERFVYQKGA